MDKKWSVMMMMFVLVVMAAIGGEAASHSCTLKCELTCSDWEFKTPCFKQCMAACEHHPFTRTLSSIKSTVADTKPMEEMRG
ncbi:hypothetical protein ISN45_At05g059250 [Arabidopsis thaliana x Arabidopsis arenosa]|uniref:Plant thionin family protein n=1 Tax=Arabidopsis thaliana x Arabidopsis arenosa TaxID=1240361 RepID=A0A8T2D9F9_9BRAS|nr:hypothetical protein ISN45_At05g059250 [Arabidopsis thaliana x Arabidopsis arenosa]